MSTKTAVLAATTALLSLLGLPAAASAHTFAGASSMPAQVASAQLTDSDDWPWDKNDDVDV